MCSLWLYGTDGEGDMKTGYSKGENEIGKNEE